MDVPRAELDGEYCHGSNRRVSVLNLSSQNPQVPIPSTTLIGRDGDLAYVRDMLSEPAARLLTLSGVGGCGKTRLAFQLASDLTADFPQRTWLVELATLDDPELVPVVVGEVLGLPESHSTSSQDELVGFLKDQPSLLLLDNCEHLVDACAAFVNTLVKNCPELLVIVTSREPLRIPGEQQYRVPPLEIPDIQALGALDTIAASPAVQLFVARAQAIVPSFELTADNADGVARICARLEGIPLALELAAARVSVLAIEEILERLDDSFQLLSGGSRVAPTRHQTLRAALAWSDELLTEEERIVFRRLAVFVGEFQLEAAEMICAGPGTPSEAILDFVSGLVSKSLVVTGRGEQRSRFRLLEPVRQYALELLNRRGEATDVRARHLAFYLDLAERAAAEFRGPEHGQWRHRLEREQGNLRAALDWSRETNPTLELRFALALAPFWEVHGQMHESLRRLRGALERNEKTDHLQLRMHALAVIGRQTYYVEQITGKADSEAIRFSREALDLARELDDNPAIAEALGDLGMFYRERADYARAIDHFEPALAILRDIGDEPGAMRTQIQLGMSIYRAGQGTNDRARAIAMLEASLDRLVEFGDLRFAGMAKVLLGQAALDHDQLERAIHLIVDGMTVHLGLNDLLLVSLDLFALGGVLLDAGQLHQAVRFVGAAQAIQERLNISAERALFVNIAEVKGNVDKLRGEAWFSAAWADGYSWSAQEATAAATEHAETLSTINQAAASATPDLELLTSRELEVARLIAEDYSNLEIAEALYISQSTVATHVHRILRKLKLRSRVQVPDWLAAHDGTTSERS